MEKGRGRKRKEKGKMREFFSINEDYRFVQCKNFGSSFSFIPMSINVALVVYHV
jgi:hypothetical protein